MAGPEDQNPPIIDTTTENASPVTKEEQTASTTADESSSVGKPIELRPGRNGLNRFPDAAAGNISAEDVASPEEAPAAAEKRTLSDELAAAAAADENADQPRDTKPAEKPEQQQAEASSTLRKEFQLIDADGADGTTYIEVDGERKRVRVNAPQQGVGDSFGLLLMALFKLFNPNTRAEGLSMMNSFYPAPGADPNNVANDPVTLERNAEMVKWVEDLNTDTPITEALEDFRRKFNLVNVVHQKSLLRPDLLNEISGNSTEAVRKRGILEDIVGEVELYNETATVKLDPYVHANQMFQESARFRENPVNTKKPDVIGFAQMKVATVNGFLRNNPDAQAVIGKTQVTEADLKDRQLATKISVNLMGHYTEKYGSQAAAMIAYNGGEGAITRVAEQLNLSRDPTVAEVMEYYQKDRVRVDNNLETGVTTQGKWDTAWAVESFEYVLLAYSPAWKVMDSIENPRFFESAFSEDDARSKMTELGIPLPVQEDAAIAVTADPAKTDAPAPPR